MTVAVIIPTLDPESEMCVAAVDAVTATAPDAFVIAEHDRDRAGFARTCNTAAARATADALVFLNDDTIAQTGWLTAILGRLDDRTIVGVHLVYPDGQTQHSGVFLQRDHAGRLEAYNRREVAESGPVPAVTGACLAVTAATFRGLGGFDEGYVNGYEDVDLCLRHRQAGGTVTYAAGCQVVHYESVSPGRFDHVAENVALLNDRWGGLPV